MVREASVESAAGAAAAPAPAAAAGVDVAAASFFSASAARFSDSASRCSSFFSAAGARWDGAAAAGEVPSNSLFRGLGLQEQLARLQIGWEEPTLYALWGPSRKMGIFEQSGHRQDFAVGW